MYLFYKNELMDTLEKVKNYTKWGKIFAIHVSDKSLVSASSGTFTTQQLKDKQLN